MNDETRKVLEALIEAGHLDVVDLFMDVEETTTVEILKEIEAEDEDDYAQIEQVAKATACGVTMYRWEVLAEDADGELERDDESEWFWTAEEAKADWTAIENGTFAREMNDKLSKEAKNRQVYEYTRALDQQPNQLRVRNHVLHEKDPKGDLGHVTKVDGDFVTVHWRQGETITYHYTELRLLG